MAATPDRESDRPAHPLRSILVAGMVPLFLGVLFSDLAYSSTYEIQWKNFASWLLVGALVFGGFALLWALVDFVGTSTGARRRQMISGLLLLAATWLTGFVDALVHAKDAWASMPAALILSAIVVALAIAAAWLGLTSAGGASR